MAVVGLLDWDLTRWKQPTAFSLELMKLGYYHKVVLRDIVQMEKKFSSEMCTKVLIQKDYEDYDYPDKIVTDPKVEWRGLALSNGIYSPMDLEIEQCPADTSIYQGFGKYYQRTEEARVAFKALMAADHLRLTLDGRTPFEGWEKQLRDSDGKTKHIIFHDKDLRAVPDLSNIVRDIANEYGRKNVRVGFKFPLLVETPDELWDWGRLSKTRGLSNFNLCSLMPDKIIDQMTPYPQRLTYLINSTHWSTETFIDSLPKIFLQAMFLSSHNITMLLKFDRDFIVHPMWYLFERVFNAYVTSRVAHRREFEYCMFTFCKYAYDKISREDKIALFQFIKEQNADLFELLYSLEYARYENGILVPHMYTHKEIMQGGGYGGYFYRKTNKGKDKPEQFNYAELIQPESIYLE